MFCSSNQSQTFSFLSLIFRVKFNSNQNYGAYQQTDIWVLYATFVSYITNLHQKYQRGVLFFHILLEYLDLIILLAPFLTLPAIIWKYICRRIGFFISRVEQGKSCYIFISLNFICKSMIPCIILLSFCPSKQHPLHPVLFHYYQSLVFKRAQHQLNHHENLCIQSDFWSYRRQYCQLSLYAYIYFLPTYCYRQQQNSQKTNKISNQYQKIELTVQRVFFFFCVTVVKIFQFDRYRICFYCADLF